MKENLGKFEVILGSVERIEKELNDLKDWVNLQIQEIKDFGNELTDPDPDHQCEYNDNDDPLGGLGVSEGVFVNVKSEIHAESFFIQEEGHDFEIENSGQDYDEEVDHKIDQNVDMLSNSNYLQDQHHEIITSNLPSTSTADNYQGDNNVKIEVPTILDGKYFSVTKRDEKSFNAKCQLCQKIMSARHIHGTKNFKNHLRKSHPEILKELDEYIRMKRREELAMNRNQNITNRDKNRIKCDICGGSFKTPYSLSHHKRRVHSKQFPCTFCSVKFTKSFYLLKHMQKCKARVTNASSKELENEKKSTEPENLPSASQVENFASSKKSCKKIPKYQECQECGRFLKNIASLKNHIKTVHLKKYKCTFEGCLERFGRNICLQTHMKNYHGNLMG